MATHPSKTALRDRRRKEGLCYDCEDPPIPGQTRCEKHAAASRRNQLNIAERHEQAGICRNTDCRNTPEPGNKYCRTCNQKSGARTAKRRRSYAEAGRCVANKSCENPPERGTTRCAEHNKQLLASNAKLKAKRIAAGLCGRDGKNPLAGPGYKLCQSCIDEGRAWHTANKAVVLAAYGGSVCVGCGDDEFAILQVDHIHGGGHKHALAIGNGDHVRGRSKVYRWLRDNGFPPGYRVLCPSCNMRAARGLPFPSGQPSSADRPSLPTMRAITIWWDDGHPAIADGYSRRAAESIGWPVGDAGSPARVRLDEDDLPTLLRLARDAGYMVSILTTVAD